MDRTIFEKRINCKRRGILLCLPLFLICLPSTGSSTACGGFIDIGSSLRSFYSPNTPGQYDLTSHCIWIVEAAAYHRVNLTFSFTGERYDGECSDYLEIRDGGPSSPIIGTYCDTHTGVNIESTNVWMFIRLRSDLIAGAGTYMDASAKAIRNTTTPYDLTDRVPECRSYEFECSNHMCISMSYRCDNYNDCGCISNCDEDGCGSLTIDLATQVSVSVVVGVVMFFLICILAYLIELRNSWNAHKKKIKVGSVGGGSMAGATSRQASMAFSKLKHPHKVAKFDSSLRLTDCES